MQTTLDLSFLDVKDSYGQFDKLFHVDKKAPHETKAQGKIRL
jgi:hypothetical protein